MRSTTLLTVDDWQRTCAREVPDRAGRPFVAYDLGHSRAWSAGVAMFRNGRTEAIAIAPGIPTIDKAGDNATACRPEHTAHSFRMGRSASRRG